MKIAAIVDDLTLSQNAFYMIKNFNELGKKLQHQPFCFYHNLSSKAITPLFSVAHVYYAMYFYGGKMIATNLNTLKTLSNIHTNAEKFFYVWDLEWLRGGFDYMSNVSLMRDKNVKLLARSESHAEAILNYCNVPVYKIIDDWDYTQLEQL